MRQAKSTQPAAAARGEAQIILNACCKCARQSKVLGWIECVHALLLAEMNENKSRSKKICSDGAQTFSRKLW
jgi:hypothetical protein